uniref:LRRCT domain-containing protein n=1 Tax=Knipowitschia caucasica TaxID=637954 RepID=A0AAV2K2D2_KNICA
MFATYGEICQRLCGCDEKDGILTVSCESRGITAISDISPPFYPLYHLLLNGNQLHKLSADDFVDYRGLTILHLGNNDILEVEAGAFNGLQGLRRLHLNNNKIDSLREELFFGLESLEYLQIDYNYITLVAPNTFHRLRHLEVLILNDNLISSLPINVFQYVPLTHLDLRGNQLKVLPYTGLLEHMNSVVELQLEENPWNCSCELIALKTWLESISYAALVGDVVFSGVLDQLTALVQVDLFENPWDCSCSILELKSWLEQLSTGTVVNNVICGSPKKLAGEDMRYIKASHFCPNNSKVLASMIPPSEESFPGSTVTIETSLDSDMHNNAIPLSVMILALLLIFIMSVFVAAGLFVTMKKRKQKNQHVQNDSMNACISSLNMEYGLYKKGTIPKVRTSAGHVYEYIPPPAEPASRTTAQTPTDHKSVDGYRDFDEISGPFLGNSDEEAASNVLSSEYSATTPELLNKPTTPHRDEPCFYRNAHNPDKRYCNTLPCKHATHSRPEPTATELPLSSPLPGFTKRIQKLL